MALPHGAHQEKLSNLGSMQEYAAKNAESWYKYVNRTRGRNLANGSLYLVTGWEKSKSWGTATFQDVVVVQDEFQLSFVPTAGADAGYKYRWQTGPARQKHVDPPVDGTPLNQTTFIHGFSISLGEGFWARILGDVSISQITDSQLQKPRSDFIPFGLHGSAFSWSFSFGGGSTTGSKSNTGRNGQVALNELSPTPEVRGSKVHENDTVFY